MQTRNDSVGGYMPAAAQPPAAGTDDVMAYYYCYEMPDGSIGYVAASEMDGQPFSPTEAAQAGWAAAPHPAGYVEPAYGEGTAYAPPAAPLDYGFRGDGAGAAYEQSLVLQQQQQQAALLRQQQEQLQHLQQQLAAQQALALQPASAPSQPAVGAALGGGGGGGMAAAPLPQLPHERGTAGRCEPPASFADMQQWEGTERWASGMGAACCTEPCYCVGACLAPWCVVAAHRRRLLDGDYARYRCCGGVCGHVDGCECCSCAPRCGLCWEVLCCLPCACHANRFMTMQRYGLKKSCWDRTVLGLGCCCAPLHCCGTCACCFPEALWDWLYVFTYPCMLTQQHRELDVREKTAV